MERTEIVSLYKNTPADGTAHLQACKSLTTEIGFRYLVYQKQ